MSVLFANLIYFLTSDSATLVVVAMQEIVIIKLRDSEETFFVCKLGCHYLGLLRLPLELTKAYN